MKKLLLFLSLLLLTFSATNAQKLEFIAQQNHHITLIQADDNHIEVRTSGEDPQIILANTSKDTLNEDAYVLAFEYFCPDGVDFLEVFYTKDLQKPRWSQSRQLEGGALPKAEAWQPYAIDLKTLSKGKWKSSEQVFRIDLGRKPGIQIQLRNMHLRTPTQAELMNADEEQAAQDSKLATAKTIDNYVKRQDWPTRIGAISVTKDDIHIAGTLKSSSAQPIVLVEYMPHENPWEASSGSIIKAEKLQGDYHVKLPRYQSDGHDRIASRFALAQKQSNDEDFTLISPATWATDLTGAAERNMPRLKPANKKGLGGITYKKGIYHKDLSDLGITASTVNIELGALINVRPNAKVIEYTHQGKTWKFNASAVQAHDKNLKQLTEMNIVTSAILLIGKNAGQLVHPDYNTAGVYAMANITSQAGSDQFRAVVSFLAERYSRPDKAFGWITHWIVFNEVDYGWTWTNMGEAPIATYMDAYEKAMRLTYIEARRFNPTAEVFISLTHNWNNTPKDAFKTYPPRALLDRLADYSALSGQYQWAIAYHPYPQSLLRPRTWEDKNASNSFNSTLITPKNIEVLDAYLSQDQFLYQGKTRTIILSEQGYHTPDYSEKSMNDKAAAIAYTWAKIMPLDSVESFHYHRWVDHPLEGGLKVGLRTLPSKEHPFGVRKEPAFSVFSALETPEAAAAITPLKAILGIEEWYEVQIPANEIKH
ncbi:DUF5722 domain-containing protein [Coraliomargarita sp. W4R72]